MQLPFGFTLTRRASTRAIAQRAETIARATADAELAASDRFDSLERQIVILETKLDVTESLLAAMNQGHFANMLRLADRLVEHGKAIEALNPIIVMAPGTKAGAA